MEDLEDYIILIPARKGSKGIPLKNRNLFDYTAKIIPENLRNKVYVSTDDDFFIKKCREFGFNYIQRDVSFALDESTTKDMIVDFVLSNNIISKNIILLYLTYPERNWENVVSAINFYKSKKCQSLLCKKEVVVSPYLMMYDLGNNQGKQIISHNLCRRQDYKKCFEISHFISIFSIKNLKNLNVNLYNSDTKFMPIQNMIDIDTIEDLEVFNEKSKHNSRDRN